jgi:phosphatidylserine/phosphatidylglycerophosphate/cardiolipin synthase-like enzyme
MKQLFDAAFEIVKLLPPSRVEAISNQIMTLSSSDDKKSILMLVNSANAKKVIHKLIDAWHLTKLSGESIGLILKSASNSREKTLAEQNIELVITGPTTPFISTRRTEQVLLDLINNAQKELFLVSFVTYHWAPIIEALENAVSRDVQVNILLEASKADGGTLDNDTSKTLRELVPQAHIYQWTSLTNQFQGGKVHAKIAVADATSAFVTSANLTGHAMEKNFEAGLLVNGGEIPSDLSNHMQGLINLNIITKHKTKNKN